MVVKKTIATSGVILIVVTHNHEVARATRRIVTLRDGKIEHDLAVSSAFEGDLIDLKNSRLGQAILHNNAELPEDLRDFAPQLKTLLERV